MNDMKNQWLNSLRLNLSFWIVFYLFVFGIRMYRPKVVLVTKEVVDAYIDIPILIFIPLFLGVFVGLVSTVIDQFFIKNVRSNSPVWKIVMRRSFYNSLVVLFVLVLGGFISKIVVENVMPDFFWDSQFSIIVLEFLILGGATFLGLSVFNTFKIIRTKVGDLYFSNLLSGKYQKPKEENRIFMFLDLKSSTSLAEKLGHEAYSYLLQDCFEDTTQAIIDNDAEVYQYVGDEVVLTWQIEGAESYSKAISTFFAFENLLEARYAYYQKVYGGVPKFKASINAGKVMVAEVGVIKKEIAYHSDVLNTASRIQALCNEFNTPLLISEEVVSHLEDHSFKIEHKGSLLLKGKKQRVGVFSVSKE